MRVLLPTAGCHKGLFWSTVATLVTNAIVKIINAFCIVTLDFLGPLTSAVENTLCMPWQKSSMMASPVSFQLVQ